MKALWLFTNSAKIYSAAAIMRMQQHNSKLLSTMMLMQDFHRQILRIYEGVRQDSVNSRNKYTLVIMPLRSLSCGP